MNFRKAIISGAVLAATTLPAAHAADKYIGGGLAFIEYTEQGISEDLSLNALYGKFGAQFNEYFAGELRLGFGIGDDSVNVGRISVDAEITNFVGAYLKAGAPVSDVFYPYAVIGFTRGELEATALGVTTSDSESDLSFGVGADFSVSETVTLSAEYMNYIDKDGGELGGFSLSIGKSF